MFIWTETRPGDIESVPHEAVAGLLGHRAYNRIANRSALSERAAQGILSQFNNLDFLLPWFGTGGRYGSAVDHFDSSSTVSQNPICESVGLPWTTLDRRELAVREGPKILVSCSRQLTGTPHRSSFRVRFGRCFPAKTASMICGERYAHCKIRLT